MLTTDGATTKRSATGTRRLARLLLGFVGAVLITVLGSAALSGNAGAQDLDGLGSLGDVLAPVTDPLSPVIEPLTPVVDSLAPVTDAVAPVIDPVVESVEPVTTPVVQSVEPATTPLLEPVAETVAPITTPVLEPVAAAAAPVLIAVVEPVVEATAPIVDPLVAPVGVVTESVARGVVAPVVQQVAAPVVREIAVPVVEQVAAPVLWAHAPTRPTPTAAAPADAIRVEATAPSAAVVVPGDVPIVEQPRADVRTLAPAGPSEAADSPVVDAVSVVDPSFATLGAPSAAIAAPAPDDAPVWPVVPRGTVPTGVLPTVAPTTSGAGANSGNPSISGGGSPSLLVAIPAHVHGPSGSSWALLVEGEPALTDGYPSWFGRPG